MNAFVIKSMVALQVGTVTTPTLTLEQALKITEKNQPQLLAARQNTLAYDALADQSKSNLLPQVAGTGKASVQTANVVIAPGTLPSSITVGKAQESAKPYPYWTFGLSVNQLVYDFGMTYGTWRSAQATTESYRQTERTTLNTLTLATRSAFFLAWYNKALVRVQQETLADQINHLAETKSFVGVGTNSQADLVTAMTNVASAKYNLINAQATYDTSKASLNQAIGVEGTIDYDVADEEMGPVDGENLSDDRLLEIALTARPDMRNLQWTAESYVRLIRAQKGQYGPSFSVIASGSEAGADITDLTWNYNLYAQATWNIFQGGQTAAQVRQNEANLASVRAQMATLRLSMRLAIVQARVAIKSAQASIVAAHEVVVNAREQLRLAEIQYKLGVGILLAVQDAQVALTTSLSQEAQSRYSLYLARSQFLNAMGKP